MKTFISEIVSDLLTDLDGLKDCKVIFPNRRAGLFFTRELSKHIQKPIWMPSVYSFEDFVLSISDLEKIDTLEGVYRLFQVYEQIHPKSESFDKFFFWGEMILRDFEEIDQYLVDADHLFTTIKTQKELDEEFYFLDEEDRKIIESFWRTFLPASSKNQEAFLETWKILKPVYHAYRESLIKAGKGYGGLIYREFIKLLENLKWEGKVVFAGFNALTRSEEKIITHFVESFGAMIYWDLDEYYFSDLKQEAGYFLRENASRSIFSGSFPKEPPSYISNPKNITATGVSLEVGQAKALSEDLKELSSKEDFEPSETVVVLPKEHMMFPALNAVPEPIKDLNITMGYPLKDTPLYHLVDSLLSLQSSRRDSLVHGASFYHRPVVEIFENPLMTLFDDGRVDDFLEEIKRRNLIFIYQDEIPQVHPIYNDIFSKPEKPLEYLLHILKSIYESEKWTSGSLEHEYLTRFYEQIDKFYHLLSDRKFEMNYDFLIRFFRRLSKSLKIPFTGEPLQGLQLMGILETRNLDFKNVFVLNMNEESWPAAPRRGSFVPYNIRRAFQMPVHEHQDSIYSYLFYRLLQRAENVFFYYNIVSEFNVNGELSRLVQQLEYESGQTIEHRILANPIKVNAPKSIAIQKDETVLRKMDRFLTSSSNWNARLTPSALDTYMHCRLKFYFRYVEQMYESDEMQEEMDPMVFGNILHDTMEILYKQFTTTQKRDIIQPGDFFWIESGVDGAIQKAFIQHYKVKNPAKFKLEGRNVIASNIIETMVKTILKYDQQYAPFRIIGLEASTRDGYTLDYPVDVHGKKLTIGLKGKIDRIDIKEGKVRIIDYKTGKDRKVFGEFSTLTERGFKDRNKAVFQVFFYSYLFLKTYKEPYETLEPGLFNSKDLFGQEFNWRVEQQIPKQAAIQVKDFAPYVEDFERSLDALLNEIWDPDIAFDQVEDPRKCLYCPYIDICGRGAASGS